MAGRYQEQHPIPQNISSYQFRLVGDMTLKQFFQVAGGSLVAILLYSSNLATFIKWPLMVISFLFGVALAFFPLEDRPLEKWIVLFFKAIYSPTQFKWVKAKQTNYFASENSTVATPIPQQDISNQPDTSKSTAPVGIHQEATTAQNELESTEQQFLTSITQQMGGTVQPVPQTQTTTTPSSSTISEETVQPVNEKTSEPKSIQSESVPSNVNDLISGVEQISVRTTPVESVSETSPETTIVSQASEPVTEPKSLNESETNTSPPAPSTVPTHDEITVSTTPSPTVQFSPDVAAPVAPTRENLVVGQVMDTNNHVIENAILEIRDKSGRPARALKTNKLGHFGIVTPLTEGEYKITTEKDGFIFEPITITVQNSVIQPIAIRATGIDSQ